MRSKENNQFGVDHAFPGVCSLCFDEIAEFNGSNEKGIPYITKFKANARQVTVLLSDDTTMNVNLCNRCAGDFKPADLRELMESEVNGWNHEVNTYLKEKWPEKKRNAYLERQSKLRVVGKLSKQKVVYMNGEAPRQEKLKFSTAENKDKRRFL